MREVKCKRCEHKIRIEDKIKLNDYTKITENSIEIYCDFCGNIELVKLDRSQAEEVR
nr:MAG TPA: DNA-directed RNA polymerase [Caudoviricetes sp.]